MSMLSRIQRGQSMQPPRILIYGTEGIGKSTFAAQAPKPVIIPTEDGLGSIDCSHFPVVHTLDEVEHALADLHSEEHAFQTIVIDSADRLERLVWDEVCAEYRVQSIDKADGGYGRGYMHALVHWRRIIAALDQLRRGRNMLTLLTAHAKIERFEDPEANAYDRFVPRLQKHAAALICEWCDALLFATRKFRTRTESTGFNRQRTIARGIGHGGGDRILRCVGGPPCMAKNRFGIAEELPLSWDAFMAAIKHC